MSMAALLKGVEARLRSSACLNDEAGSVCGVQDDGEPPPRYGQVYFAVHPGNPPVAGDDQNAQSDDRLYAVAVTITARLNVVPADRRGVRITTEGELLDQAEAVADWLHQDESHRLAANEFIPGAGETANGFVEPLKFKSVGLVLPVKPGWGGVQKPDAGTVAVAVQFGGARRVRPIGG